MKAYRGEVIPFVGLDYRATVCGRGVWGTTSSLGAANRFLYRCEHLCDAEDSK